MKRKVKATTPQILLAIHLRELGIETVPEHKFVESRGFRFDLYSAKLRMAFECNGGQYSGGHRRGKRIDDENEKLNIAALLGVRVLQFTNEAILDGHAKQFVSDWLQISKEAKP